MRQARLPVTLVLLGCAALYGCDDDDDDDGPIDPGPTGIELETVATGLTSPIALADPDDGSGRLLIADQAGVIRVLESNGTLRTEPFLDLRSKIVTLMPDYDERGLLGLALSPDYATSGRFFVYYTAPPRTGQFDNTSVISEFTVSADPNRADAASEVVLLEIDQPQFNHEGGTVAFGPDGMLYISIGDGGGAGDIGSVEAAEWEAGDHQGHVPDWYEANAGGNGQDITENLLGDILRIDVSAPGTYSVPADNPFVGEDGLDETYAYGFRNPYRFSFDRTTGDLLVGDAGQNMWEEVSIVESGGNYGWNVKEGTHCFDAADFTSEPASCPSTDPETGEPLVDPVIELLNSSNPAAAPGEGILTVIGGYVYRGDAISELDGRYVFGSFHSAGFSDPAAGQIFVADPAATGLWPVDVLELEGVTGEDIGRYILSFGEDAEGELYVLTTRSLGPTGSTGVVLKLVPAGGGAADMDDETGGTGGGDTGGGDTGGGGGDPY